jgi:hypothetical protein
VTRNRHTRPLLLLYAVTFISLAGAASSQERLSLERMKADNCAAADVHGESYRPAYCDERCDPLLASASSASSCDETTVGTYQATLLVNTTCGALMNVFGLAQDVCVHPDWGPVSGDEPCSCAVDALGNITCPPCSDPSDTCFFLEDNSIPGVGGVAGGVCVPPCSNDIDCTGAFTADLTISGVDPSVDSSPATYISSGDFQSGPTTINSRDARACLAGIEVLLGQPCTSLP